MTAYFSGIQIILYLDDWLRLANSLEEILRARESILTYLKELDILINREECLLFLKDTSTCLGMLINSLFLDFLILETKVHVLRRANSKILAKLLLGHIYSTAKCISGARLQMRPLQ